MDFALSFCLYGCIVYSCRRRDARCWLERAFYLTKLRPSRFTSVTVFGDSPSQAARLSTLTCAVACWLVCLWLNKLLHKGSSDAPDLSVTGAKERQREKGKAKGCVSLLFSFRLSLDQCLMCFTWKRSAVVACANFGRGRREDFWWNSEKSHLPAAVAAVRVNQTAELCLSVDGYSRWKLQL